MNKKLIILLSLAYCMPQSMQSSEAFSDALGRVQDQAEIVGRGVDSEIASTLGWQATREIHDASRNVRNAINSVNTPPTTKSLFRDALRGSCDFAYGFAEKLGDGVTTKIANTVIDLTAYYVKSKIDSINDKTFQVIKPSKITERLSSLGGYHAEKDACKSLLDYLKDPKEYLKKGAKIISGLLLTGAPGTGKTLFAKALAGQMECPLIIVTGSELLSTDQSKHSGSDLVRKLFTLARTWATVDKPCIIFIDEIDAIGKQRTAHSATSQASVLTTLLTELENKVDRHPIIFIASTNHKEHLDGALIRPGRIDLIIDVKLPSKEDRIDILKVHLQNVAHDQNIKFAAIADKTPNMTGADLAQIVQISSRIVLEKKLPAITDQVLQQALNLKLYGCTQDEFDHQSYRIKAYQQAARALILKEKEVGITINSVTISPQHQKEQKFAGIVFTATKPACVTERDLRNEICQYLAVFCSDAFFFNTATDIGLHDKQCAEQLAEKLKATYGCTQSVDDILQTHVKEVNDLFAMHKSKIVNIAQELLTEKILYQDALSTMLPTASSQLFDLKNNPQYQDFVHTLDCFEQQFRKQKKH